MKKLFTLFVAVLLTASMLAQSPEKMSYQAVIRDASDNLVTSQTVGMQITILQGSASGTAVYIETQTPTTNANGLVSIEIGDGTVLSGDFITIDWANGPYFIKTETDPAGNTSYTITGTSQLLSVPYALHAKTAETVTGGITEADPVYSGSDAANITATDITNLSNLSGTNTGDQDLSTLATKTALGDSTAQVRSEIPDISGFLTSETDPVFTAWDKTTGISITESQISDLDHFTAVDETDPSVPSGTQTGEMQYWNGFAWVTVTVGNEGQILTFTGGVPTWKTPGLNDVENPATGKIWMDRNLGASRVALSSADGAAYGDLYQWGRTTDGHEIRTSGITSTLSDSDTPGHGDFILGSEPWYDWRGPQNDNLWQGVSGINNPCPSGYRLPTLAEWDAERQSWTSNDAAGAFASPLKLPVAGFRYSTYGSLGSVGFWGGYWASTVDSIYSGLLDFDGSSASVTFSDRAFGFSVRCLKD